VGVTGVGLAVVAGVEEPDQRYSEAFGTTRYSETSSAVRSLSVMSDMVSPFSVTDECRFYVVETTHPS